MTKHRGSTSGARFVRAAARGRTNCARFVYDDGWQAQAVVGFVHEMRQFYRREWKTECTSLVRFVDVLSTVGGG
jgi:hypothetical protein